MECGCKSKFTRGATPTHTFKLPDEVDTSAIKNLTITYNQYGETIIKLDKDKVQIGEHDIQYMLSQSDTLKFAAGGDVEIQVKIMLNVGTVLVSQIMRVSVENVLDAEVML